MLKKNWLKKSVIFLLITVALIFVISYILIDVALIPSKMEKLQLFEDITEESMEALVQTNDIQQNKKNSMAVTKEWLSSVPTKKVSVVTDDGYQLIGRFFLQQKEAHNWVILLHGYTGWKEEMNPLAYEYYQKGYQVLTPDMRCQGESEGDFIGMGWTDREDNLLWLEMILNLDPNAQIVLHGQSMGASCALMMTGEDLPVNVKAVVSDCAYTDVYSMFQKQLKEWFHLPAFPILDAAAITLQLRGGYNLKEASALKEVKKSKLPILFIHGSEDSFIPVEMAEELYRAADTRKELLVVEGAGHAQSSDKDPKKYYDTVFSFLEKCGIK